MRRIVSLVLLLLTGSAAFAQLARLGEDIEWKLTGQGSAGSGDVAPFWFTSNNYGLGPLEHSHGLTRASIMRSAEADSQRSWRVGYGLDLAGYYSTDNTRFVVQQAFLDIEWKVLRLSIGQKERVSELKNRELSTGGLTLGMNARPVPQLRGEIADYLNIPGTRGWLAFRGHLAYGRYTDNKWQEQFNDGTDNIYTSDSWYHSKALFVRLGSYERFPLTLTGGLEMTCQYGGIGQNHTNYNELEHLRDIKLGGNMWTAIIPGGEDFNDGFANAAGNHIGSWHLRLDGGFKDWKLGAYMEHVFEDQSQMFLQYGMWKDMLLGVEVNLPANPWLSALVYEYNGTMNQTGPLLHDATPEAPDQISALDNYYNHHIYGTYQHAGFSMGNPTLLSPLYNDYLGHHGSLYAYHNRVKAHHFGLKGNPSARWSWRLLYTHERSLGTYEQPLIDPQEANFLLAEATHHCPFGLDVTLSYGHNDGALLGTSNGYMLTLSYGGKINRKH